MSHEQHAASCTPPRAMAARYLIAAAAVAAVAACGSTAGTAAGSGSSGSSPAAAKASLHITVLGSPGHAARRWTLTCDPAGGTHPDPATACRELLAFKNPFAPVPAHRICPMILASAGRATITGTWFGTKVDRIIIDGGCDLARWAKLGQVVN